MIANESSYPHRYPWSNNNGMESNLIPDPNLNLNRNPNPNPIQQNQNVNPDQNQSAGSYGRTMGYESAENGFEAYTPYPEHTEYRSYEAGNAQAGDKKLHLSPKLVMPYKAVNEVWSIYGKRGSGKSYFWGRMSEELNRIGVPFLVIDVKDAHELIELPGVVHTHMNKVQPVSLVNMLGNGQSVILSLKGSGIDEMRSYVAEMCDALNRCRFGKRFGHPMMLALEECHNFIGQGSGSAGGDGKTRSQCLSSVDKLIREGRADGIGVVLISQSVSNVLASVRRQVEIKIIFMIKDHTDIQNLERMLIGKTKQDVRDVIDRIYHLSIGQFACISTLYIQDPGILIDKTSERRTRHAGRSFIEGDGDMLPTGDSDILGVPFEVDSDGPDMVPSELEPEPEPAEVYSAGPAITADGTKLINYKNALIVGLGVMSVLGIALVVFKKYMEHKSLESERVMDERLREEQRKVLALQNQYPDDEQQQQQGYNNNTNTNTMPADDTPAGLLSQFLDAGVMPPDVKEELGYDPTFTSMPF